MKKYLQTTWMRVISCILCTITLISLGISLIALAYFVEWGGTDQVYDKGMQKIAENYALYALDQVNAENIEDLEVYLAEKGISCSVEKITNQYGVNEGEGEMTETLFSNETADTVWEYELDLVSGSAYYYEVDSLLRALGGFTYHETVEDWIEFPVTAYLFDANTGIFYYETEIGYFKVTGIDVYQNESYIDYELHTVDGKEVYYNGYYDVILDHTQYISWNSVRIHNGNLMGLSEAGGNGSEIQVVHDSSIFENRVRNIDYTEEGDTILSYYAEDFMDQYRIQISWSGTEVSHNMFGEWTSWYGIIDQFEPYVIPSIILSFVLFVVSAALLIYTSIDDKEKLGFLHRVPVCIYSGIVLCIEALLAVILCQGVVESLIYYSLIPVEDAVVLGLMVLAVILFIAFVYLQNIIARIRTKSFWRYSEFYYVIKGLKWCGDKVSQPFKIAFYGVREHTPLFWKGIVLLGGVSIVEFFILMVCAYDPEALTIWFVLGKLIEIPLVLYVLMQMKFLQEGGKRIATGDLTHPIDTSKMLWEFKKHGENINNVSNSIQIAVEEQMKSERFKTELITNVSHDIKTPLTSIINYVDLIKKEEIADEKLLEYVDVLDRQSARLKKLIEDLMEASKASTGNLAVNLEECDTEVLLTQVIGEFEEKLQANNLEVVVEKPEHPVLVMADGRHMWRVLDNLLNNACKYSMPNTRVYVSLKQEGGKATIVFKNISKAALNIPSDELMERFVRGDSSRNTEGSGLGLSIAQSLTELMGGTMKLDIDGDLFKVTLTFNAIMK